MSQAEAKRGLGGARPRSGYLPTLDGWRAIAVCLVIVSHMSREGMKRGYLVAYLGQFGVDLFFSISGYLICSRLLDEERLRGRISLAGFYIRRSFRILPPALLYLCVVALLGFLKVLPENWRTWWGALAFIRNYQPSYELYGEWYNAHFWSLAVEEHFYLILPSLLVFLPTRRKTVLCTLMVAGFAWEVFYLLTTPVATQTLLWEHRTDLRLNSLLFPALLAILLAQDSVRTRVRRFVTPLSVGLVLAVLFSLVAAPHLAHQLRLRHSSPAASGAAMAPLASDPSATGYGQSLDLIEGFAVPVIFPFILLATMLHPGSLVSRGLEWMPMRAVGRISYSLYLWQQLFLLWYRHPEWPIHRVQNNAWSLPLLVLCAVGSYVLIEKPAIRLGHRLAHPATPGHADLDAPGGGAVGAAASR